MASTNETKVTGIPVPAEGTPEFEKMNRMARRAIPLVLIIFIFGILEQQAFGMIFVNIGQQLGTPELASLITSLPGIALGIVCVIYGSLGDFVSLKKMTLLGVIVFVIGSVIGFVCGGMSIWFVVIARMLQSIGGQVAGSVFLVLVSKYVSCLLWYFRSGFQIFSSSWCCGSWVYHKTGLAVDVCNSNHLRFIHSGIG